MSKPRRRKSGKPFVQLYRSVKRSHAYHSLSLPARCALIELLDQFNGSNNGTIGLGLRQLAKSLRCSQATAQRAFRELDDSGLVWPMKVGVWRGRQATTWRIAFYRCDATGDLPVTMWPPTSEVHHESAEGSPRKRKRPPRFTSEAQEPKNPLKNTSSRFTREAHIESNHGGTELDTPPDPFPDLPDCLDRRSKISRAEIERK